MNALIVSFFESNNIGDILISRTLSDGFEKLGYHVIKYDFLSAQRVKEYKSTISSECKNSNLQFVLGFNEIVRSKIQAYLYIHWKKRKIILTEFEKDLQITDIVVFAGGNMIMDVTGSWPFILQDYCKCIKKHKKEYVFLAVGVGPILNKKSMETYAGILKEADYISTRGSLSNELAMKISGRPCYQMVDPVLALECKVLSYRKRMNQSVSKEYVVGIGFIGKACLKSKCEYRDYVANMEKLIKYLSSNTYIKEIVLFSTEAADYTTINKVIEYFKSIEKIHIFHWSSIEQLVEEYKRFSFIISARMHSLIIAQRLEVPYLGIIWQQKLIEFAEITETQDRMVAISDISKIKLNQNAIKTLCSESSILRMREINEKIQRRFSLNFGVKF